MFFPRFIKDQLIHGEEAKRLVIKPQARGMRHNASKAKSALHHVRIISQY